jgi:hypothetical protein
MFGHQTVAGVLADKLGDRPGFACIWIVLVAFGIVIALVKKGQKEKEVADREQQAARLRQQSQQREEANRERQLEPQRREPHRAKEPAKAGGEAGPERVSGIVRTLGQRREASRALATEWGVEFHADDPWNLPDTYKDFQRFNVGHSRHASNVIAGEIGGAPVVLFDYQYRTGYGPEEAVHLSQVAVLELPVETPRLEMGRGGVLGEMGAWAGREDVAIDSEAFGRRCRVRCEDAGFARGLLTERLVRALMEGGAIPAVAMHGRVMVLATDGAGDAEGMRRLLAVGRKIGESLGQGGGEA